MATAIGRVRTTKTRKYLLVTEIYEARCTPAAVSEERSQSCSNAGVLSIRANITWSKMVKPKCELSQHPDVRLLRDPLCTSRRAAASAPG
jgi:hypothetical protein